MWEKIKTHNQIIKSSTQVCKKDKEILKKIQENEKECFQSFEEFTILRMKSLKQIFKLHPSLKHILISQISVK